MLVAGAAWAWVEFFILVWCLADGDAVRPEPGGGLRGIDVVGGDGLGRAIDHVDPLGELGVVHFRGRGCEGGGLQVVGCGCWAFGKGVGGEVMVGSFHMQ